MIGSYGSGSNRPHSKNDLAKARQALSLLKEHKARGETAAQKIGAYILGGDSDSGKYKKATSTAYESKFGAKPNNTNYRKVFNPVQDDDEGLEEEKYAPAPHYNAGKGRLTKVNNKFNGNPPMPDPKPMSNLANLGRKALGPTSEIVSNEFGMRPPIKNPVKRTVPATKPPMRNTKPPMMRKPYEEVEDDRPIKPIKGSFPVPEPEEEEDVGPVGGCRFCGRKFNPESLAKHQKVCLDRPDKKKRKVFDSKKARIVSEEQKKLQTQSKKLEAKKPPKKIPKWKVLSAQFRNAIKATKGNDDGNGGGGHGLPPEMDERSYYKQCPTCGRSFNEEAAKRHIPFCANKAKLDAMKNGGKAKAQPAAQNKYGRRKY